MIYSSYYFDWLWFYHTQISASGERMYHDAYTIDVVDERHIQTHNVVAGMVPFLLNLIKDVS